MTRARIGRFRRAQREDLDDLTDEQTPQGEVGYQYDVARRRQSMTVVGQPSVSYSWDNANRLSSITQGSTAIPFAYDSANRRSTLTLPNGIVLAYTYDNDSRVTAMTWTLAGSAYADLEYQYDADGRVTQKTGGLYSQTNLPTAVSNNTFNAADEMTAFNGTPQTYDPNGNLTNDGANTYSWDARNQLVSLAGPTSASFAYDALGRRVGQTITGAATQYLYDLANAVMPLQEFSSSGAPLLSGLGTSRADLGGTMTFLPDAKGNTIALTDNSGAIQTQYSYGPFGTVSVSGAASTNPYQFGDMQNDGTGLYYTSGGYYSPTFGLGIGGPALGTGASQNASTPGKGSCDKCQAELKYHHVWWHSIPLPWEHSFWYVHQAGTNGSSSPGLFLSGEPSNYPEPKTSYLALFTWQDGQSAPQGVSDNSGNGDAFDSGCSSDNCSDVQNILNAAFIAWPPFEGDYTYVFEGGPNSNTLAHWFANCSGFPNVTPPDGSTGKGGWNSPALLGFPPC
jgi:YD repeat-containing protein